MCRFVLCAFFLVGLTQGSEIPEGTDHPQQRSLLLTELKRVAELSEYDNFVSDILRPIMRVRPPGTKGHHKVKTFIKDQFENLNWTVTLDDFDRDTPIGRKHFTNIVATLNPNAKERLVLAAHYDSKLFDPVNGEYFVAATDSAVPCAMMIELARTLTQFFVSQKQQQTPNITLEMFFFDGEEAFKEWTQEDSLYGSRHLAEVMENASLKASKGVQNTLVKTTNRIPSIKTLILLDLIGAANPTFYDNFPETSDLYERLQFAERRLTSMSQLGYHPRPYFPGRMGYPAYVEDDHIPFLRRGVPILHVIPLPFPLCWHKFCDNEASLDQKSIHDLIKIFRVFIAEYFNLTLNK